MINIGSGDRLEIEKAFQYVETYELSGDNKAFENATKIFRSFGEKMGEDIESLRYAYYELLETARMVGYGTTVVSAIGSTISSAWDGIAGWMV